MKKLLNKIDMKQTVEEAAREYSNDCRNRQRHCEPYCIVDFISGAEWQSKQSPWISVKERLPEENKEYLVVLDNRVIYVAQYNKNNKSWLIYGTGYTYNVVAYMPIPSFDEILEENRDVLERIKEKGD
jgi:hypothetical protein